MSRWETARRALAAAETATGLRSGDVEGVGALVPVPPALASLFREGGLRAGTVTQVSGSTTVLLALAVAAAGDGAWCALVAMPDAGLAAAADAGLDLDRMVVIPAPGPDAAAVLGALVDGFDVVVAGACAVLTERDQRALGQRVRSRGAVVFSAAPWPGAQTALAVSEPRWSGVGQGDGHLRGAEVTVMARGAGPMRTAHVRLGGLTAIEAAPVPERAEWVRAG